jgi:hypothetical protein
MSLVSSLLDAFCTKAWFPILVFCISHAVVEGWSNQKPQVGRRTSLLPSLKAFGSDEDFPQPLVWQWSPKEEEVEEWISAKDLSMVPTALRTWNWSRRFVLKLNLCPWAKGSLETQNAMQVFVVPKEQDIAYRFGNHADRICKQVAEKCLRFCEEFPALQAAAIFFVVFQEEDEDEDDDRWENFIDFYEWFTDLEDNWEIDDIIIAPFHPNWQFGGDGGDTQDSLDFEKKSPFPTVTFVSAKVVERAGEAVTEQISEHNEQVLLERTPENLKDMWNASSSV